MGTETQVTQFPHLGNTKRPSPSRSNHCIRRRAPLGAPTADRSPCCSRAFASSRPQGPVRRVTARPSAGGGHAAPHSGYQAHEPSLCRRGRGKKNVGESETGYSRMPARGASSSALSTVPDPGWLRLTSRKCPAREQPGPTCAASAGTDRFSNHVERLFEKSTQSIRTGLACFLGRIGNQDP